MRRARQVRFASRTVGTSCPGRGLAPRKEVMAIEPSLTMLALLLVILWIMR